jgi:hypothetical protein
VLVEESRNQEVDLAIVMRLVQRFQASKKREFIEFEKQFAELEARGILPKGERMLPLASRDPGNTLIWQSHFPSVSAAQACLRKFETSPEHTELVHKQSPFFEDTWVEFYEILDC